MTQEYKVLNVFIKRCCLQRGSLKKADQIAMQLPEVIFQVFGARFSHGFS